MNLTIIENIILNVILIIFPLLVYLVLVCNQENISKSYNKLLLNIILFTSLYLSLRYGMVTTSSKILLFCNIPIVIAYIKKEPITAIILSIINITYCYYNDQR